MRYLLGILALSACVHTSPQLLTALAPAGEIGDASYIQCDSGCAVPWQRAQVWLAKHSTMKVQTATDVLLETYNPTGGIGRLGFSLTKEPTATPGSYRINVQAVCTGTLGCAPTDVEARQALLYYVKTGKDVLDQPGLLGVTNSIQ